MKSSEHIGIVILAAGASLRLGEPKQLLKFRSTSLLQHVIDVCFNIDSSAKVLVLGAHSDQILKSIDTKGFHVAINADWQEGIACSIRLGVTQSLKLNPNLQHLLFLLSDQPFVSKELLQHLITAHHSSGKTVTACCYQDTIGVPAIFSSARFPELLRLQGDRGAGQLIKNEKELGIVDFELGYFDVDTQEDYERLKGIKS